MSWKIIWNGSLNPSGPSKKAFAGFHGQPIIYKGEVLGTLAVFDREPVTNEATVWFSHDCRSCGRGPSPMRAPSKKSNSSKPNWNWKIPSSKKKVLEAQNFGEIVLGRVPPIANLVEQIELVAPHRCHGIDFRRVRNRQRIGRA